MACMCLQGIGYILILHIKSDTKCNGFFVSLAMIILSGPGFINVLTGAILHNVGAFIVHLNSSKVL